MINENVVSAAVAITENVRSQELVVRPIDGSLVDTLIRESIPVRTYSGESAGDAVQAITVSSRDEDYAGVNQHDLVQDDIVTLASTTLDRMLKTARDVVAPTAVRLSEEAVELYGPANRNPFEITTYSMPLIYSSGSFMAAINNHDEVVTQLPVMPPLPEMTVEQLLETIKTDQPMYDKEIVEYLATLPEDFLISTYNTIRQPTHDSFPIQRTGTGKITGIVGDLRMADGAAVMHLICRGLRKNIPPGTGMSLIDWELITSLYIRLSATLAALYITKANQMIRDQKIVVAVTRTGPRDETVCVYKPVYLDFLEKGGTPELLMAGLLSPEKLTHSPAILSKVESLQLVWQRFLGETDHRSAERLRVEMPKIITSLVIKALPELLAEDNMAPCDRHAKIADCAAALPFELLKETQWGVIQVIAEGVFSDSDLGGLLMDMENKARAEGAPTDMRVIAYQAVSDYIAHWLVAMVEIKRT